MVSVAVVLVAACICLAHWSYTHPHQPLMLALARLLRRVGRWFWAAGEGLEHGFLHSQQVKRQIRLDLEVLR